jgi:hypothetical protein
MRPGALQKFERTYKDFPHRKYLKHSYQSLFSAAQFRGKKKVSGEPRTRAVKFNRERKPQHSGKHKIVAIKKTVIFFFAFPLSSGKFGKQSLRFRAAKTFFFGITVFLYQNKNPADHLICWKQFYVSLKHVALR